MSDRILVVYATKAGSTGEVADVVGQVLADGTANNGKRSVDVRPADEIQDVSPYRAVVLGTGIRAGQVYGDALSFLEQHHDGLSRVPVAFFVVCLTMKEDTDENRCEVETYVDQMRKRAPRVEPVDVGLFAGAVNYKRLSLPFKMILKAMKEPEEDHRDWVAIREWAAGLELTLMGEQPATKME